MTTALLVRRFLADYARTPVNLLMLVLIPVVFVLVAAAPLADAAKLLGGAGGGPPVETATAGWAAGFLAGLAMYFQVSAARDTDRRLILAGIGTGRLVAGRLVTGLVLAALASMAALLTLAVGEGIDAPVRVAAGTLMFAVIYLAIGAVVGATVRDPVNGTVLIMFVWIIDVFFGPTLSSADRVFTRALPTHFTSLWMVDLPSRHGGRLGDLGWSLAWTVGALAVGYAVVARAARVARTERKDRPGTSGDQFAATLRAAWRDSRRNPVLWALLAVVPAVFILLSDAITPHGATRVLVVENGRRLSRAFDPAHIHAGTMAPSAIASLAALIGIFAVLGARSGDQRLTLAGIRPVVLLGARIAVVAASALVATGFSLAVTATVFDAHNWPVYAVGNALLAVTYAMLGVLIGPVFGRVAGVFVAFLIPFLDLGILQSPMLRQEPADWAAWLPGYGATRVVMDGALTTGFDGTRPLLAGLAWMVGLTIAATVLFRRATRIAR
jgi:hypothetical protein